MAKGLFERACSDAASHGPSTALQSLRGAAALVVVVYHGALYFDYDPAARSWILALFNAHAAVVLFFVLSGLLLTLSLLRTPFAAMPIGLFYLRRAFRIYPALWLGCAAALGYWMIAGDRAAAAAGSRWAIDNFDGWPTSIAPLVLAFAGLKPGLPLPIWSLAIELAASALMPAIVLAMRRSVGLFVVLLGLLAIVALSGFERPSLLPVYLVDFALGAAIALVAPAWRPILRSRGGAYGSFTAGMLLLWGGRWLLGVDLAGGYHDGGAATLEAAGAALAIGTLYVRAEWFGRLARAGWTRLGDRSYSLYLLHQPLLGLFAAFGMATAPLFVARHPGYATILLVAATLVTSIPLAGWAFRWIEMPAIGLGQALARRIARGSRSVPRGGRWPRARRLGAMRG